MQEQEQMSKDWREDVSDTSKATLKIMQGESTRFVFLDEGKKNHHSDYGDSIVFTVEHDKEEKRFFVNPDNFSLLKQIKAIENLTGKLVKISREGSKKSDTRYTIEEIKMAEETTQEEIKPEDIEEPKEEETSEAEED